MILTLTRADGERHYLDPHGILRIGPAPAAFAGCWARIEYRNGGADTVEGTPADIATAVQLAREIP